ncbi:hypothetical protein [Streptomyces sp. NPDC101776]|uniref:hypothetical protein n=1 Tax=Streptomyces sp. NPDC101776 TaxID=3366146 RepID=UPI003829756E
MSDELSTQLATALREFAADQETRPVLTGAEVRGRAGHRARRRTAGTLGAGAVALALVAFVLTLGLGDLTGSTGVSDPAGAGQRRQAPAATPSVSAPAPAPRVTAEATPTPVSSTPAAGTVALGKGVLVVGDRVMRLTSGLPESPEVVGPLTVYKKPDTKVVTVPVLTSQAAYVTEVSLAVELRDAHDEPVYVGIAVSYKGENTGTDAINSGSWIGLDSADAKWFYDNARIGSVLSVTGTQS